MSIDSDPPASPARAILAVAAMIVAATLILLGIVFGLAVGSTP